MPASPDAVYLDHAATTPMPSAVREAYLEALGLIGNPSSIHTHGQAARDLLETGREQVAASLGVDPVEVVFTGGGTEAVNLAIKGTFWSRNLGGRVATVGSVSRPRILTTRAEHHATLDAVDWLVRHEGAEVDWIDVDAVGRLSLASLEQALARDPESIALVTALWANNEVGTLQPVAEIVRLAHAAGVPVHLDAIAAYGAVPIDVHTVGADLVSVSAHKIGGPVGIGALVVARTATVEPLIHGGNQQRARSGTQDAAGAAAFGVAAGLPHDTTALAALRDRLIAGLLELPGVVLRGDPDPAGRLPGNVHVTFAGCDGDALLYLLDRAGFSVSTGSACQAGVAEVSHVLLAMGVPTEEARGALRFTLGPDTTPGAIDALLAVLPGLLERARSASVSR
ncbi:cysteine desulfurase family protein [Pseudolysinimonas yzui]|uniref:Cysteine desulfurase n=1 Tax=Pseudolysinimonas yzui TaxID=2708254 RepID=A0A8J3GN93_9MICO|nr:cysteine desulfurase family protein [Pseudolysinimonas yzui]GHF06444.1 cysteine desulfurase [Pseudolysinimonas yzui]